MKRIFTMLTVLIPAVCFGQKLPDFGLNKVRIIKQDTVIQAELLPVSSPPKKCEDKFYFWYSSNTIHSTQGGYSGRLLNGLYNEYFADKSLKTQGQFKKGLKHGIWREWNEKETLKSLYTWKNGIKNGKFELFDDSGLIKDIGEYDNGELVANDHKTFWKKLNVFRKK